MINYISSHWLREPFSGLSHFTGALLALGAIGFMVLNAPQNMFYTYIASYLCFGLGMLFMFLSSAIYHLADFADATTVKLKRIDHIAIYFMIAGTYTPFCLIGLDEDTRWPMLSLVWFLASAGVLKKIFWLSAPRWLSTLLYLGLGWLSLLIYPDLKQNIDTKAINWLIAGGIIYSLGAIIYGLKWPKLNKKFGFHELWHLFVLGGAGCHFISIGFYL